MVVKRFNERRAEEERRKAAFADTEEVRRGHIEIAEIFEARAKARFGRREASLH
jgi:hypothetical protein